MNGKTKTSIYPSWKMIPNHGLVKDSDLNERIDYYANKIQEQLAEVVGICQAPLDSSNVRLGEASMGNLITDALKDRLGAEISLVNGGAIRGHRLYLAETKLTKLDIQEELPFNNICVLVEISGKELTATLEAGLSKIETSSGAFLQVSGIKLVYDPNGVPGNRIHELTINGEIVDENRYYRVATTDYLLKGGDGNSGLKNARVIMGPGVGPLLTSIVIDYVSQQMSITKNLEGRILDRDLQRDIKKINVSGKRVRLN